MTMTNNNEASGLESVIEGASGPNVSSKTSDKEISDFNKRINAFIEEDNARIDAALNNVARRMDSRQYTDSDLSFLKRISEPRTLLEKLYAVASKRIERMLEVAIKKYYGLKSNISGLEKIGEKIAEGASISAHKVKGGAIAIKNSLGHKFASNKMYSMTGVNISPYSENTVKRYWHGIGYLGKAGVISSSGLAGFLGYMAAGNFAAGDIVGMVLSGMGSLMFAGIACDILREGYYRNHAKY